MEYISSDEAKAIESLRQLIYNFLSAEEDIKASVRCNEISDWVHSVVGGLNPSIENYSKRQIDLVIAIFPVDILSVKRLIPDLKEDYGSYISKKLSIGIYAPEGELESILFGETGYYE